MSESYPARMNRLLRVINRVALGVAALAVLTLVVDVGWIPTLEGHLRRLAFFLNGIVVALFLVEYFLRAVLATSVLRHVRDNPFDTFLTLVVLFAAVFARSIHESARIGATLREQDITLGRLYLIIAQSYILLMLISKLVAYQKQLVAAKFRPGSVVLTSFAFVIFLGTILLSSPQAISAGEREAGRHIPLIDALFTSTSAVCVTGLVINDLGTYFSTFGQLVVLCLIQIGGLGLMTLVAFTSLIIGKRLPISERVVMQDTLSYEVANRLPRMIVFILLVTFGTEALGALILYPSWLGDCTAARRAYLSAFHAVSAYCNAGFSLFPANLMDYANSIPVVGVITGLIIFGGIGFAVQGEAAGKAWYYIKTRRYGRHRVLKNLAAVENPVYLSTHSRVVLTTTMLLLVCGTILFAGLEWTGVLSGMGFKERVLASWFQSVTPRTAGFNTVDIGMCRMVTLLVIMALMFIGASPGGTGGGVKTSTFAVVVATVRATIRNKLNVEMFQRTIPLQTIRQSLTIVFLAIVLVSSGAIVLAATQPGIPLERLLFEEISAFGTVGLSTGTSGTHLGPTVLSLSAAFTWVGKLVIILTMFAGRVGALALIITIAHRVSKANFEYPSEGVTVG